LIASDEQPTLRLGPETATTATVSVTCLTCLHAWPVDTARLTAALLRRRLRGGRPGI